MRKKLLIDVGRKGLISLVDDADEDEGPDFGALSAFLPVETPYCRGCVFIDYGGVCLAC